MYFSMSLSAMSSRSYPRDTISFSFATVYLLHFSLVCYSHKPSSHICFIA